MKRLLIAIPALSISIGSVPAKEPPTLKPVGDKMLLHVDGAPFPILGGHVMNSSFFDPAWMDSVFDRMKAFHLNTLIAPIPWQAVEQEEGQVDFSLVDSLVKQARDRSAPAQRAFGGKVPEPLMNHLAGNKDRLTPHLKQVWALGGYKTKGTWSEVFGQDIEADEIFITWHCARYINRMAAAAWGADTTPEF